MSDTREAMQITIVKQVQRERGIKAWGCYHNANKRFLQCYPVPGQTSNHRTQHRLFRPENLPIQCDQPPERYQVAFSHA